MGKPRKRPEEIRRLGRRGPKKKITIPDEELFSFLKQKYCVEALTLQAIGDILGVTRERIRQLLRGFGIPRRLGPKEATEKAKKLFDKGYTKEEILETFCICEKHVEKARERWEKEKLKERFKELYLKKLKYEQIAEILSIPINRVRAMAGSLISKGISRQRRKRWSKKEINELAELYNKGLSYKEISKKLGRFPVSVTTKIANLRTKGILKPRAKKLKPKKLRRKAV